MTFAITFFIYVYFINPAIGAWAISSRNWPWWIGIFACIGWAIVLTIIRGISGQKEKQEYQEDMQLKGQPVSSRNWYYIAFTTHVVPTIVFYLIFSWTK
jgi:hypothetical protein